MKPTELIDAVTQLYVKPALRAHAFRKKASTFWRDNGEVIDVVNVQKSQWNSPMSASFTINIGLYWKRAQELIGETVAALPPHEYDCTIRERLGSLFADRDYWWEVTSTTDIDSIGADVVEKLLEFGLPWLERGHDLEQSLRYAKRRGGALLALRRAGRI